MSYPADKPYHVPKATKLIVYVQQKIVQKTYLLIHLDNLLQHRKTAAASEALCGKASKKFQLILVIWSMAKGKFETYKNSTG